MWFLKNLQRCHHQIAKSTERIIKKFCKDLAITVGQRRNTCFVIFRINHSQKKRNKGREGKHYKLLFNTFPENMALQLTLQQRENFNSKVLISEPVITLWKVAYYQKNGKIHWEFQHLLKADLILLTDTLTLHSTNQSKPSCASSWSTDLTLGKYRCNNVQLRRCTPTKVRTIKSANYLHLHTEQLLGTP